MFHPMKALETKWNAHTPKFLHNGTKENVIFQLLLTLMIILGYTTKSWVEERSLRRERASWSDDEPIRLSDYR